MQPYKLLTPGPLTTSDAVKRAMLFDRCTWDNDYKSVTQRIRAELLELAHAPVESYTTVLMQGSGTFGVESVLSTALGSEDRCLLLINGAYGQRMKTICRYHDIAYIAHEVPFDRIFSVPEVEEILRSNRLITHVAMVHCETTTGILNNLADIAELCRTYKKLLIVDAMSSFGGMEIDVPALGINYLVSSSNKCIQGVPGFSLVVARRAALQAVRGRARSLSLDLYDQWEQMEKDGKWRFTSPTHTVAAFAQALEELAAEGGIAARSRRYARSGQVLREGMRVLGFVPYVDEAVQSPIITTFLYPNAKFDFAAYYVYLKANGYVVYPGKLTDMDSFRIGNIGEVDETDMQNVLRLTRDFMEGTACEK